MQHDVYRFDQRTDIGFRTSASNPRGSGFRRQLRRQMNRDHEDRKLGMPASDLTCHIYPVQIRHAEIQNHNIGRRTLDPGQRFFAGPRLSTDLPFLLLLENRTQVMANCRIVVHYENPNQLGPQLLLRIDL